MEQQKITKILYNQVALLAGVVGVLFGIFNMIQTPKNDIKIMETLNNIRDNHIHTLEVKLDDQSKQLIEMQQQLIRLQTILEERLPIKK